jgi:hypothetical protein
VYNVSQTYTQVSGTRYLISAFAAEAPNGGSIPDCSISICGAGSCNQGVPLTSSYKLYSYQFVAPSSDQSAIATVSVSCTQSAYVALDNLAVSAADAASNPSNPTTVYLTTTLTVVKSQAGAPAQTRTLTQLSSGSDRIITETTMVDVPHTQYLNITGTTMAVSTSTSK